MKIDFKGNRTLLTISIATFLINKILTNDLPQLQSSQITYENRFTQHDSKIAEFDEKIKTFNSESVNLLGKHFKDTCIEFKKSANYWLIGLGLGFLSVLILDFKSLNGVKTAELKDFLWLLPINIFVFSILYFIAAQYSHYKKLAMDYRNRETVATSYLSIVNTAQTEESKNKIATIVADTLFSRNVTDQGPDLPMKEAVRLMDAGASIIKR
jgi:hypothetical protein